MIGQVMGQVDLYSINKPYRCECGYFLLLRAQIFEVYMLHAPYNTLPISKIIKFLQQSKLSELNWEDDEAILHKMR